MYFKKIIHILLFGIIVRICDSTVLDAIPSRIEAVASSTSLLSANEERRVRFCRKMSTAKSWTCSNR